MKGVLPIIKHNSGCDYHRVILPMKYLGFDIGSISRISTDEMLKETKILFFNRNPENPFEKVIKFREKYGFKLVLDLDDYWFLNTNHPLYPTWIKNKMGEQIVQWIENADAVTVTTSRLANRVRHFNKNVHVIPNGLPFGDDQFNTERIPHTHTRFVYTGGESHVRDVDILKVPFTKLKQANMIPYSRFTLAGYSEKNPKVWDKMEKVFKITGNYNLIPFKSLHEYMTVYEEADVSIVPLEHNMFTPYKSNLKILEAGCKNMPVICSDVPPYSDEPNKDVILFASNVREWVSHIKYCYENNNFVKEKGLELGEYVRKNYDLRKINEHRKQLFEHLMS